MSHREHRETTIEEREPYAQRLRAYFHQQPWSPANADDTGPEITS
jgi:hypothetical protein